MEISEILHQFETKQNSFARSAAEAAVERREEITPELLRILHECVEKAEKTGKCGSNAHLYAMLLLAQFRETRAYPLILRLAQLPSDTLEYVCGDFVTGNLGSVLASVCGGELGGIQSLIENEEADEWARGAGIEGLVTLVGAGLVNRETVVDYFASLYRGKLARDYSFVWEALVSGSTDIYPEELIGDIRQAYADDLVDTQFMGLEDVERELAMGRDRVLATLASHRHHQLADDIVKEMEGWAWNDGPSLAEIVSPVEARASLATPVALSPQWRAIPKIGRNEPCPCGSGKKYKKCCLQ